MDHNIDLLEQRIAKLELTVLPKEMPNDNEDDSVKKQLVTDLLMQTNAMIAASLSCREVATSLLNRMPEINDYLDPNYGSNLPGSVYQKQFILEFYPQIKRTTELLIRLKEIRPIIESINLDSLEERLGIAMVSNAEIYKESQEMIANFIQSMQQFNTVISSLKVVFLQLESACEEIENFWASDSANA